MKWDFKPFFATLDCWYAQYSGQRTIRKRNRLTEFKKMVLLIGNTARENLTGREAYA
jgi:hypothetical protein